MFSRVAEWAREYKCGEGDGLGDGLKFHFLISGVTALVGVKKVVVCIAAGLIYGEVQAKHLPVKEGRKNDAIGVPHVMAQTLVDLLSVYREKHGIEYTVLATTNVYGLRQREEDGVVAAFASEAYQRPLVAC